MTTLTYPYQRALEAAKAYFPSGVTAAARQNKALGGPFFISKADGPYIFDTENKFFIDLDMGAGTSLLGHNSPHISDALSRALSDGVACGYELEASTELAELISRSVPSIEKMRFCTSGTEATAHAVRLARTVTGRNILVKFEGHFHGASDVLGFSIRPDLKKLSDEDSPPYKPIPESAGIPEECEKLIRILPFNDLQSVSELFAREGNNIAAVILEPVNYNGGTILPEPGFLRELQRVTSNYGALFIFDEILSGFRTGINCIQGHYGIAPDITVLGKCLGAGMIVSLVGGKSSVLEHFAPQGRAKHTGIFVAHPLSIHASVSFLRHVSEPAFFPNMLENHEYFYSNVRNLFRKFNVNIRLNALGARFSLLFSVPEGQRITNYRHLKFHDGERALLFYRLAFEEGIYFKPSLHHGLSAAHTVSVINDVLERLEKVLRKYKKYE